MNASASKRSAEATLSLQAAVTPAQARHLRARIARVAGWLGEVWAGTDVPPPFTWASLSSLPAWALGTPAELERLALLCGALFAAPALRVCLDAGPLLRVRGLIGAAALDRVLAVPGLPPVAPPWPANQDGERDTLRAWGVALMITSLPEPPLRESLARMLSSSVDDAPLLPASIAVRMVGLAHQILTTPDAGNAAREERLS